MPITDKVKISIVISVYNCDTYLSEAIESILSQTFTDWELLICDDGSMDNTYSIGRKYKQLYPNKIRLMRLHRNCKQAVARNKCLERANGKYIAIMDGDDTCDSERLEKEYSFLESHPEVDFAGTGMKIFDENGAWGVSIPKKNPERTDFVKGSPFCAATCLYRKEVIDAIDGYREGKKYWRLEDLDLFVRLYANGFTGMNIQEPLYNYREYKEAIGRRNLIMRISRALYVKEIVKLLELPTWMQLYGLKVLALGLLPQKIYSVLHRLKYRFKVSA